MDATRVEGRCLLGSRRRHGERAADGWVSQRDGPHARGTTLIVGIVNNRLRAFDLADGELGRAVRGRHSVSPQDHDVAEALAEVEVARMASAWTPRGRWVADGPSTVRFELSKVAR